MCERPSPFLQMAVVKYALSVAVASTQLVRVNDVHQAKGSGTLSRLLSAVLVVVCTGAFFHSLRRMGVSALLGIVGVGVQLLALSVTVALHKAYRLSLPTSMDEVMPLLYVIIGFDPLVAVARFFSSSCGALMPSTLSAHLSPVSSAPALSAQRVVGHGNGYAECGVCGDEACAMWACEHLEALRWAVRVDVLVKSGVLIELYALFKTHRYLSTALPVITFMACAYVVHKVLCGTLYLACFCVRTPQSVAMVTPVVREYQSREKISIAQVHSSVDGRDVAETCARAVTLTCAVLSLSFIQLQDGAEAKFRTVPVLAISDMSQKLLSHFRRHGNEPWVVGRHRDVFAQLYSTGDERTADSVMSGSCAVATREYWGVDDDTMRTTLQVAVVVACAFLLYNVFKTRKATAHAHAHTLTQTRTNAPAHSNSKRDRSDITGALQKDSVDGEDLRAEGGSACEVAQQHNTTATRQDAGDIKRQGTNHHNNRQNTTVYNDYGCVIGTHIISDKAPHSADTSRGIHAQAQAHIQQQQQQLQPKTSVGLLSPTNVRKVRRATYNATHLDTIHSHSNAHTHTTPHRTHHHATHTGQGTDMAIRERFFTLSSSSSSLVEDITQPNQANSTQHDSPHASTRKDSASPDRQTIVPASPTVVVTTPRGTSDKAQAADATLEGCDATDTHAHVQVKGQNAQDTLAKDVPVTTDDRTASHENSEQTSAQDAHERWIDAIHNGRAEAVSDEDVIRLVKAKRIPPHRLEKVLNDYTRGVRIRRLLLTQDAIQYHNDAHSHSDKPLTANAQMKASATNAQLLDSLPYEGMDYTKVLGMS
ncbi:hypothetical protein, variant [Sphaeroforma arctica JP610]|uniref:Transmembrane protein n=1 Tax=Sphaeroforma arctica JP610 TaxID=667725 RepID=A0A0L0GCH7_9EUKA|nr:hypothetical protein, variant [Sphaeroforma arctica JP610]KNC85968.1 hypothetical protein, variant [Sphaeroforma arctica JP610]|eukprot:XP_014159870.1 hypothetical protein, variant [Sphaeroforma arctica JP610]